MLPFRQTLLLARTDIGEMIPFLVFVVVMVARAAKMFTERGRGGSHGQPLDEPPPGPGDAADPGAQIRRFLEDLRRQAQGEPPSAMPFPTPSAPPASPPASIPRTAPVPARPAARPPEAVARRAAEVRSRPPVPSRPKPGRTGKPAPVAPAPVPMSAVPRAVPPTAVKVAPPPRTASPYVTALRRGPDGLRAAAVLREVLGPPVGLRR